MNPAMWRRVSQPGYTPVILQAIRAGFRKSVLCGVRESPVVSGKKPSWASSRERSNFPAKQLKTKDYRLQGKQAGVLQQPWVCDACGISGRAPSQWSSQPQGFTRMLSASKYKDIAQGQKRKTKHEKRLYENWAQILLMGQKIESKGMGKGTEAGRDQLRPWWFESTSQYKARSNITRQFLSNSRCSDIFMKYKAAQTKKEFSEDHKVFTGTKITKMVSPTQDVNLAPKQLQRDTMLHGCLLL